MWPAYSPAGSRAPVPSQQTRVLPAQGPETPVRFLRPEEEALLPKTPQGLREELVAALSGGTLCALFAGDKPSWSQT